MTGQKQLEKYVLTGSQMREVDRIAIEEYEIPGIELMENAGEASFREVLAMLDASQAKSRKASCGTHTRFDANTHSDTGPDSDPSSFDTVLILCGSGNNGGDGYVIARKLLEAGYRAKVYSLAAVTSLKDDAKNAYERFLTGGGTVHTLTDETDSGNGGLSAALSDLETALKECGLIVDALLGTGIDRPVKDLYREAITMVSNASKPVLAVDIPSGIGGNDGRIYGSAIKADTTVTFQAPKTGCVVSPGREYAGRLTVADIGIPEEIIRRMCED